MDSWNNVLVVIAMSNKGIEVLGPANTNRDVLYEGLIVNRRQMEGGIPNGWKREKIRSI